MQAIPWVTTKDAFRSKPLPYSKVPHRLRSPTMHSDRSQRTKASGNSAWRECMPITPCHARPSPAVSHSRQPTTPPLGSCVCLLRMHLKTSQFCANYCSGLGMPFFGLQYSRE